jgi:hypothetical protein
VRRGCTRSELERAHLLLSLKLKPDRAVVFGERLELVDEHCDLEAVRDQARMSALLLYRMLHKGYSFLMSAVVDEEAADRQRAREAAASAAAAATLSKQQPAAPILPENPPRETDRVPIANTRTAKPNAKAAAIAVPRLSKAAVVAAAPTALHT